MSYDLQEWFAAIHRGDIAAVESRLARHPALASARHESGLSSVMWACYSRQPAIVTRLVAAGVALDLFEAVAVGDERACHMWLMRDQSLVTAWTPDGFTALHFAAFFARPALAGRLLELGADPAAAARNESAVQPLHSAAASGDIATARMLLQRRVDPDARQALGFTALMSAAQQGNTAFVELLLKRGADRTLRSEDGRMAADFADERGHHALAATLRAEPAAG